MKSSADFRFLRLALRLAQRGRGQTSPNPMVGAVLVRAGKVIGRGWHHRAGNPHAEIEALRDAAHRGERVRGATLYVTLEPCSSHGRTPACTDAVIAAGLRRVVVAATDPNPQHVGRAFGLLRRAGIKVDHGLLVAEATRLNEAFNHWIVHRTPCVIVKAAMSLDGRIATASGESKWITGEAARAHGMKLRLDADAVLVGINTVLADDPSLTLRLPLSGQPPPKPLRRIILDSLARTPPSARVVTDDAAALTTIVVTRAAPARRVAALARRVRMLVAPRARERAHAAGAGPPRIDLRWLMKKLGAEGVTNLLVEGGGEVNAAFLEQRLAHRVAFFYAPMIIGGRSAPRGVAGTGATGWSDILRLRDVKQRRLGADLFFTAGVGQ
ncbi:MAG: bifunctional diaminohydroxyphosphoribosylaminopyrimidine deaminase/5-amino-6-(5-phosphoribosylamino)uracil reductase RibD [Verrucomicrobiota bacterium]